MPEVVEGVVPVVVLDGLLEKVKQRTKIRPQPCLSLHPVCTFYLKLSNKLLKLTMPPT